MDKDKALEFIAEFCDRNGLEMFKPVILSQVNVEIEALEAELLWVHGRISELLGQKNRDMRQPNEECSRTEH